MMCRLFKSVLLHEGQGHSSRSKFKLLCFVPLYNFKILYFIFMKLSTNIRHDQTMYREKKNRSASFSSDVIMPNLFISYSAVVSAPYLLHRLKDFYTVRLSKDGSYCGVLRRCAEPTT